MMSAENKLRCNNLKCRRYVAADGKAVVTTCSRMSIVSAYDCLWVPKAEIQMYFAVSPRPTKRSEIALG